jgi:hypothetical protein
VQGLPWMVGSHDDRSVSSSECGGVYGGEAFTHVVCFKWTAPIDFRGLFSMRGSGARPAWRCRSDVSVHLSWLVVDGTMIVPEEEHS